MEGTQLERLFNVHEAAEVFRNSHYTVRAWIREGRLKAVKLGRLVRIEQSEIQRMVAEGRTK